MSDPKLQIEQRLERIENAIMMVAKQLTKPSYFLTPDEYKEIERILYGPPPPPESDYRSDTIGGRLNDYRRLSST